MKWAFFAVCLLLSAQHLAAQANLTVGLDTHGSDSVMAQVMARRYAPAWRQTADNAWPAFSMVGIHRPPGDPRVVPRERLWVPPSPSLFAAQDEYEWEMQPHTFGEYFVNGVFDMLTTFFEK